VTLATTALRRPTCRPTTAVRSLTAFAACLALWAAAPSAPASAADRCDGVWVVVDATAAGAGTTTRCASGDPATGLAALEGAGHAYGFVPRVPGMVCTIDARPDPCNGAPTDAYWSYWSAEPGGSWVYNSRGAGTRDPKPGQVEGWAFGAGAPPRTAPPSNPPPAPTEDPDGSTSEPAASSGSRTRSSSPPASTPAPSKPAPREPTPDRPADVDATRTSEADPERVGSAAERDDAQTDDAQGNDAQGNDAQGNDAQSDDAAAPDEEDAVAGTAPASPPPYSPSPRPTPLRTEPADPTDPREAPLALEARPRTANDEVALGAPGSGAMTGLFAGGALVAAIAGGGVVQARRRRREFDA
jgi:hypothetical protein